jgi:hypothetical protein
MPETVQEAWPDLTPTDEYLQWRCGCGIVNGSNVCTDPIGDKFVVCGSCWTKVRYADAEVVEWPQ